MKYGNSYYCLDLKPKAMLLVEDAIKSAGKISSGGTIDTQNFLSKGLRSSEVAWIKEPEHSKIFFDIAQLVNKECGWNVGIKECEPMQYTLYNQVGDYYDWHIDQSGPRILPQGKRVRKISMTLWLSEPDEYEGGEFELELYGPDAEKRTKSFKEKKGRAIFFLSDMWHKVHPIKSGVRKSLVAWFVGDPYV
tara:strand:+ start:45 stop:620 length:576 start_codon:yes stop_codon:yes gene_type:complete